MNEKIELLTVRETAEYLNISQTKVRMLKNDDILLPIKDGVTKFKKQDVENLKRLLEWNNNSISPFGNMAFDYDESLKLLDNFNNPFNVTMSPTKFATKMKYAVTNKGRIVNLTTNRIYKQYPAAHGYLQVCLKKNGKNMPVRVHRVTAFLWCKNGKYKGHVHHIDGNKLNNNATNLIFMTDFEHTKAHKLMEISKKSNDWVKYNDFIKSVQKDNECTEDIRFITDLTSNIPHYIYIVKSAYEDLKRGIRKIDELRINEIRGEFVGE